MATGKVVVEKIRGRSTATSCFSKYPLKFILPTKVPLSILLKKSVHLFKFPDSEVRYPNFQVAPVGTDVVWIYSITYGGGIVSVFLSLPFSLSVNLSINNAFESEQVVNLQGDSISCEFTINDGCTAVLTTQSSTKVKNQTHSVSFFLD